MLDHDSSDGKPNKLAPRMDVRSTVLQLRASAFDSIARQLKSQLVIGLSARFSSKA